MTYAIAITGSAGYIGSVMCQYYRDLGYRVIDVDRNDREIANYEDSYVEDFSDQCLWMNELVRSYRDGKLIGIVHLAAEDLIGPSYTDPKKYYINNVSKSQRLIDQLMYFGVDVPFIFASSAAVYGLNVDGSQVPINTYGKSKYQFEQILEDYGTAYNFKSTAFRFFNVVGGYKHLGQPIDQPHVLTSLFRARDSSKPFVVQGRNYNTPDGTVIRDYIHVIDVCDTILYRMKEKASAPFEWFDLGTGRGTSLMELYNSFKLVLARGLDIDYTEPRANDPGKLIAKYHRAPKHSSMNEILYSAYYAYEAMKKKKEQSV
jgi:UDP-glucose 4-epimerase